MSLNIDQPSFYFFTIFAVDWSFCNEISRQLVCPNRQLRVSLTLRCYFIQEYQFLAETITYTFLSGMQTKTEIFPPALYFMAID